MAIADALEHWLPITDPVLVFATVCLLILVAPLLMRLVRFPAASVVGLILAGVLIGPGALGVIHYEHDLIHLLAAVGLLYIMFESGLDIDAGQFLRYRRASAIFGLLTFLIPQTLGTAMALVLLGMSWPAAILLASMFASHTLVSYPVATRLGIARSRAVTTGVGGTVITDTLALLVLAVIAASYGGEIGAPFWVRLTVAIGAFAFIMLWGVPRLGRWYFRHYADGSMRDFVFVIAVVFASGTVARLAGVEPIIGAFLAGIALSRLIPVQSALMSRIKFIGGAIFIPFFLVSIGMRVDIGLLLAALREAWIVIAAMSATVIATKYLAAQAAQAALGYSRAEGNVLFGLSVPQAAATLAAVFIGVRIGLFDAAVLNGAIMMILITCIIGPWVTERSGRAVALAEEKRPYEPGTAPLRILVPMANPASALPLLDLAFVIRRPDSREPVYPLTVASESGDVRAQVATGEQMLGHAVIHASNAPDGAVPVVPITSVDLDVASGISRAIKEHRISTVVIGWSGSAPAFRGPGGARAILGSVLDRILEDSPQTVLVCRLAGPIVPPLEGRVVLLVPRFIERDPAFPEAVRTIKQMASKLKSEMLVLASESEIKHLEATLRRIRPLVGMELAAVESWPEVDWLLARHVRDEDMIVMLNTREGRLPWSPDLHRLPRVLAQRFPRNSLVVFYPSELTAETAWFAGSLAGALPGAAGTASPGGAPALSAGRTKLRMASTEFGEAISEIIAMEFADDSQAKSDVRDALVRSARETFTQIAPGVALVHAHVPHVPGLRFFLATFPDGIAVPRIDPPVRVLLILLSPRDVAPEAHLRALAGIARLVRSSQTIDAIAAADDFHQLHDALFGQRAGKERAANGEASP